MKSSTLRLLLSNLILLLLVSSCAFTRCAAVYVAIADNKADNNVTGRALYRGEPLQDADVSAYETVDDLVKNTPVAAAKTDSDGNYSMRVPQGRFFFAVRKGDTYYAYSGRNPVNITDADEHWLGFQAVKAETVTTTGYDDEFSSAISGVVMFNDAPVKNAAVTVFLDSLDDFKGPGYSMATSGPDGDFFFDYLPESGYFILVRKRGSGEKVGPMAEGDLYAYFPGNPVMTENGRTKNIVVNCVAKIDDERIVSNPPPATGIAGRILDRSGKPVAGLYVFAYTDPVIGHKRPYALSLATKDDGRFVLELKAGGVYYIGARQRHGDSPTPGELFGMYDLTPDHSIKVDNNNFIQDIDIIVEEIMMQ